MEKLWRDKSCEKCVYQVGRECRLNPPLAVSCDVSRYPRRYFEIRESLGAGISGAIIKEGFLSACAKYDEGDNEVKP